MFLSSLSLNLCQRSRFLSLIISNERRSAARRYSALKTHVRDVKSTGDCGLKHTSGEELGEPLRGGID